MGPIIHIIICILTITIDHVQETIVRHIRVLLVQVTIALTVTIAIIIMMAIVVPDAIVIAQTAVHPVQTETAETAEQLQLRINHLQQILQE